MKPTYLAAALAGLLAISLTSTGCGPDESATAKTTPQSASVTVTRPWVKAVDGGMTAAFGTLQNSADSAVRVTSATTKASPTVVLHETKQQDDGGSEMREMKGGLAIPAGGKHELVPGGDHIMLMDVTKAIAPGDQVDLTLVFADGSRKTFTAPARSFSGAKESYAPDDHS